MKVETLTQLKNILNRENLTVKINVKLAENIKYAPLTIPAESVLQFIENTQWYTMDSDESKHGEFRVMFSEEQNTLYLT